MKLAIVGSRRFNNYEKLKKVLVRYKDITEIVSGGAAGADSLAEKYALENHIPIKVFFANWSKHGKAAGPIRNKLIIERADKVVAFHTKNSRGTESSIRFARSMNKELEIITF